MANKSVFASLRGRRSAATAVNKAGGPAFAYEAKHKLAQLAVTGTFGDLFYANAEPQAADMAEAAATVDETFLAKAAILARGRGHMKDAPAFLLAVLSGRDPVLFARTFPRVIDNGRMLRTFVQIMRSGAAGRTSLGSRPKRMVAAWLENASDTAILRASVGNDPSLGDVIKMVHPKPKDERRSALLAWIIGKPAEVSLLPEAVQEFLRLKAEGQGPLPDLPFQMLTSVPLTQRQWMKIAERVGWQALRMNLNSFARHGVFARRSVTDALATRLADEREIARSRVLPYQLLAAQSHLTADVPASIRLALERAMEIAMDNVPAIEGQVVVCPDVSGSMSSPVTGFRKGATTAVRMVDVAALVAASVLRKNPRAKVLPFDTAVRDVRLDPGLPVSANARILAGFLGGGTNCAAPLERLNERRLDADLVLFVSDNQSWFGRSAGSQTGMAKEWKRLKKRCPDARMACIDIAPYGTAQVPEGGDVLNIGGFSDHVFDVVAGFAKGEADSFVSRVDEVRI